MDYEVATLQDGWAGTDQTVATISRLVEDSLQDPVVVGLAHDVIRNVPERDRNAEMRAVSAFVRSNVRYTSESIETIKTPRLMADEIRRKGKAVGDCDDSVVLWAALLRVLGFRVRFSVVSQRPDGLANHIFGEVWSPTLNRWVTDDTIVKNRPLGWRIPAKEVTNEKNYEMGGLSMHSRLRLRSWDPFRTSTRAGTRKMMSRPARSGTGQVMFSASTSPSEYALKTGGQMVVDAEGNVSGCGGMGFLPEIISAAFSVKKKLDKTKGQAAAAKVAAQGPGPAAPPAATSRGSSSTPLLIGLAALAAVFILPKILR